MPLASRGISVTRRVLRPDPPGPKPTPPARGAVVEKQPPPPRRLESAAATVTFLIAAALAAFARLNDARAFAAVATPALYCWLALCSACAVGLLLVNHNRRIGRHTPTYFRVLLLLGVAGGLLTIEPALRVITKEDERPLPPTPLAPVDMRGEAVSDRSFAGQNLRRSQLSRVVLRHVDLSQADLSESDLRKALFKDVNLSEADLCGADLRGADLRGAKNLDSVERWTYAFYDSETRLPRDFDLFEIAGPLPDTGRGLLYMCRPNETQQIEP